jgi:hypothetical protein
MDRQKENSSFRYYGQFTTFILIGWILVFGTLNKINLDWKGFVFLTSLEVILVVPWISEINFFELFKIKKGINDISDKLQAIETKIEISSNAKAQNVTYNVTIPNLENFVKQQNGSETGNSTLKEENSVIKSESI